MNKCDICATTNSGFWSSFTECSVKIRNWEQEFATKKGRKKDDNDNFSFCKECGEEFKNYLADKVVEELKQKNLIDIEKSWLHNSNFTKEGQQKVQKAITENIKRHKNEWQIKEMNWNRDGEYYQQDHFGCQKIKSKIILLHQSAQIEYSSNGFLIMDWPKMYWKKLYPSNQWTEIEEVLNQEQKNSKNQPSTKNILIILGVIGLIIGIITLLVYLVKRRKKVKNKIN